MKNYLHYGVNVYLRFVREGNFINILQKNQIEYFELPYIEKMKTEKIIAYEGKGTNKRMFAIIVPYGSPEKSGEKVYITPEVPIDGNWNKLISDVDAQRRGSIPMEVESRLHRVLDILLEAESDFSHLRIGLNAYGYDINTLDQINAPDVDQDFLKKIMLS